MYEFFWKEDQERCSRCFSPRHKRSECPTKKNVTVKQDKELQEQKIQSLKIQVVQEHPKEAKVQQSIDLEPIPCKEVTPKFNLDNPSVEESQDEEVHLKTHVDTSDATMEEPSIEVGPNVPYLDPTTLKIGEHEKTQG